MNKDKAPTTRVFSVSMDRRHALMLEALQARWTEGNRSRAMAHALELAFAHEFGEASPSAALRQGKKA